MPLTFLPGRCNAAHPQRSLYALCVFRLYFDAYTLILRGHSGSCDADGSAQFTAARPSARAAAPFYPHQGSPGHNRAAAHDRGGGALTRMLDRRVDATLAAVVEWKPVPARPGCLRVDRPACPGPWRLQVALGNEIMAGLDRAVHGIELGERPALPLLRGGYAALRAVSFACRLIERFVADDDRDGSGAGARAVARRRRSAWVLRVLRGGA